MKHCIENWILSRYNMSISFNIQSVMFGKYTYCNDLQVNILIKLHLDIIWKVNITGMICMFQVDKMYLARTGKIVCHHTKFLICSTLIFDVLTSKSWDTNIKPWPFWLKLETKFRPKKANKLNEFKDVCTCFFFL